MTPPEPTALRRIARRARSFLTRPEAARIDRLEDSMRVQHDEITELRALLEFVRAEAQRNGEHSAQVAEQNLRWAEEFDAFVRSWVKEYFTSVRDHVVHHAEEAAEIERRQLDTRLHRLERAVRQLTSASAAAPGTSTADATPEALPTQATTAAATGLTFAYESFEDVLRGDPATVGGLQQAYVDRLAELPHPELPLIDIGCGRGELLGLLRDAGQLAYGVDTSPTFVEDCRDAGLEVVAGDAMAHLATLEPSSVRGVTAFHVVEHLTLDQQLELLDQCRRVLAPGGIVVFETPNPENLGVGACSFWLDPTHLRPLPPQLLAFMVTDAGFEDVEILRLHPAQPIQPPGGGAEMAAIASWLSDLLRGPMDYAVIGRRGDDL